MDKRIGVYYRLSFRAAVPGGAFLSVAATYSGEISSSIWIWLPLAQTRLFARIFHGGNIAKRLCAARCANARRRRGSCRDRRFCLKRPAGRRGRRNIFTGRNRRCSPLCRAFFPVRRGKSCRPAGKCIAETRSSPCALASRLPKFYAELRRGVLSRSPRQVVLPGRKMRCGSMFFPARHGKSARKIPCKLPPLSSRVRGIPAPAIGPTRC